MFRAVVVVMCLMLAAAGCGLVGQSPEELLQQAKDYYAKGERASAILQLKTALQRKENFAEARFLLGVIHNERRDAPAAEAELRRAKELGLVEGGRVLVELGRALVHGRKFKQTFEEIKTNPSFEDDANAAIIALRGHAHYSLGQHLEARGAFAEAAKVKADNDQVILLSARLRLLEKDLAGADAEVGRILERRPKDLDALLFRADILRYQGKIEETLDAYAAILVLEPNFLLVRIARAMSEMGRGNFPAAQQDVDAMMRFAKGNPMTQYVQALVHFRTGKYTDAQAAVLLAQRGAPNNPQVQLLSGAISYAVGSYAQAEHTLSQIVHAYPGEVYARELLAATLVELNQGKRALETIKPLLVKDLQDSTVAVLAGDIFMREGDYRKAADLMEKAVALSPKDASMHMRLALSRIGSGDLNSGVAAFEIASSLETGKYRADFLLVLTQMRRGDYEKALQAAMVLEKKMPKSALAQNLKGAAYLGKKDAGKARESFERALQFEPQNFVALDQLARLDVQANNSAAARKRYEEAVARDGRNARAMTALSAIAAKAGDNAGSIKWLEQAAKSDDKSSEIQVLLAMAYLNNRDAKKALAAALAAQKIDPEDPTVLDTLGLIQLANGEHGGALVTLNKAVVVAPQSALAHYRLASAKVLVGDKRGVEASLQTALQVAPNHFDSLTTLGQVYVNAGRFDEAVRLAQQLRKYYPRSATGFVLEGDALMMQKKYAQAQKIFEAALGVEKAGLVAVKIYMAQSRAGSPAEATTRLGLWVKDHPDDVGVRRFLADAYTQLNKPAEAVVQLEWILQKYPDDALALNYLADALQRLKDPRALEIAEKAYKRSPDSPLVADTLAWVLVERGQLPRALELLRKAVAQQPKMAEIRYHLAVALARSGDKEGARRELDQALAGGARFNGIDQAKALYKEL